MAGGAVGSGVIVDLSRLDSLGDVDTRVRRVRAGPGAICKSIDDAARKSGLRFPVDPSSAAFCTIGGMVSTNAAGAHSLKFGATRSWVRSLDCVFADGSRALVSRGQAAPPVPPIQNFLGRTENIRKQWASAAADHARLRKDSSGYALTRYFESGDLIDLLVGSEGTLAIIVGVELDLAPVAKKTSSLLARFSTIDAAAKGAQAARAAGASACELLDKTFLDLAAAGGSETRPGFDADGTGAILLIELEADNEASSQADASSVREMLEAAGAQTVEIALTDQSEKEVWELRHAASPILSQLKSLTSMQFIEDGAVPPENLPGYVLGVREALARRSVEGVIFGHAGDAHVHVNPLIDVSKPDWRETVNSLLGDVVSLTGRLEGTLCGEHGDGRLRTPLMSRVWSEAAMNAFAEVKRCFDPQMTLNPGVKVPLAGQQAIGNVKYDPSLPPIHQSARKALDEIVARRGYAEYRLSLIDGIS